MLTIRKTLRWSFFQPGLGCPLVFAGSHLQCVHLPHNSVSNEPNCAHISAGQDMAALERRGARWVMIVKGDNCLIPENDPSEFSPCERWVPFPPASVATFGDLFYLFLLFSLSADLPQSQTAADVQRSGGYQRLVSQPVASRWVRATAPGAGPPASQTPAHQLPSIDPHRQSPSALRLSPQPLSSPHHTPAAKTGSDTV